jgi:hypothetical protein
MGVEVKFIRRFVDQLAEDLRDVVFPVGARSVDVHERSGVLLVALLALLVWPASHILAVVIGFMPILFIVYELRDWSDRRAGRVEKPALIQVDLNVLWSRWRASRSAKAKAPLEEPIPLASGTAREAASELLKVLAAEQPEAGPQLEPIRTEILQAETMGQVKFIPSGELAKAPEMQHPLFPACGIQTQEDVDVAVQRFEELPAQWVRAVFVVAKTQELAASAEEKLKAAGAKRVILVLWSSVADSSSGRPVLDDVIMGTDRPGDVREAILAGLKADAESDKSIRIPLIAFADWEVRSPLLKIVAFLQRLLGGRPLLIHLETPEEVRKILVIRSSA